MQMLVEMIAPLVCVACGVRADGDLCGSCAGDLEPITGEVCPRCGTPDVEAAGVGGCPRCRGLGGFARARSLVVYADPARRLVLSLKRRGRPGLAGDVGGVLADLARREGMVDATTVVAHVPGGRRSRFVGFDHAELLARAVAGRLGVPLHPLLRRIADGPRQADVPLDRRRRNAKGRFGARRCAGRVLLVDDVFTTGATAEACALALGVAGADRVDVLTFARTIRHDPRPGRP